MKKLGILFLLISSLQSVIAQQTLQLSSAEISFVYLSNNTDGSISGFSSSATLDEANPRNSVFEGSVSTETIKTGNFLRDWSLKGSKYFDADTYPKITFKSTSVSATDSGYSVDGDLTIKKTTKPITIKFVRNGTTLTGTTTLYASDYGIHVKKDRADNKVSVQMVFQLK